MGGGSEIVGMPGVSELGPWVLIAVLLAPKLWDGVLTFLGKKKDAEVSIRTADSQTEAARISAEVQIKLEEVKGDYERQRSFHDRVVQRCDKQMDEIEALLDRIGVLNGTVMERDAIIRKQAAEGLEKDRKMAEMQRELEELRRELDKLKQHVKAIEVDRDKIKAACVVEIPKE